MLSADEQCRFQRDGYLVFERLIKAEDLVGFVKILDRLVHRGKKMETPDPHFSLEFDATQALIPGLLHKVQGVCVVEPQVLALAAYAAILDRVEALLGQEIDVFGTKFFPKLPGGGTSTHWHQDNFYFGTTSEQIISCGVYLQEADTDNGCLQVVPGSHLSGEIVAHSHTPGSHGSWTKVDEEQAVSLPLAAGSVVLFSANLLHGTQDNTSQRSRYSTAWHYVPGTLALDNFPRGEYEDRHIVREN